MKPAGKIALVALGLAVVGAGVGFYIYTEVGKEPALSVTNINPTRRSATITIGKKSFPYTFANGSVTYLGKVSPFYTAQVVAYDIVDPDESARIDIKLMRSGKLIKTKTVYLG